MNERLQIIAYAVTLGLLLALVDASFNRRLETIKASLEILLMMP